MSYNIILPRMSYLVPANYPEIKSSVESVENLTSEVAKGVFSAIYSYVKEAYPLLIHQYSVKNPGCLAN